MIKTLQKVKLKITWFLVSSRTAFQEDSLSDLIQMSSTHSYLAPLQLSPLLGPDPAVLMKVAESAVNSLMSTI